jgi:hypothetical protein
MKKLYFKDYGLPLDLGRCNVSGKIKYDKRGAQTAKNKRWCDERIELRIYNCPHCNYWHLTSLINKTNEETE